MELLAPSAEIKTLLISTPAFLHRETIPIIFSCDGLNVNPPLRIDAMPIDTISLAVIMEDPDAPIHTWTHWLIWNIPATTHIEQDTHLGVCGINDFKKSCYSGPCPIQGTHRYVWKVYTLNKMLKLKKGASKKELELAMLESITGYGELTGLYK